MTLDRFHLSYDPAIDWSDGATDPAWLRTRDATALRCKPGARAVTYHCQRLTLEQYAWTEEVSGDALRAARAFRCAVRKIEWADRSWTPVGVDARDFRAMTESEMAEHADIADVLEIGGQILERAATPRDFAAVFTLRPSSHHALVAALQRLRSAVPSPASPPPTASEPAASSEP